VLPSTTFLEATGTMIDYLGRFKLLQKVIEPQGTSKNHRDIFIALSKILKSPINRPTEAEIKKALKVKTKLTFSPFVKKEGLDVPPKDFIESINDSIIKGRRLSWLKTAVEAVEVTAA
jgi:anaerobic selenocysteine-containing dehydrogenase